MSTNIFSDTLDDRLMSALRSPEAVQELSDIIEAQASTESGSDLSVTVTLSPSQITNLFTTPVTLIPAPGAGQLIIIKQIYLTYNFVSSAYTDSLDIRIAYSDNSNTFLALNDLLEQTQDKARINTSFSSVTYDSVNANTSVIILSDTLNPSGGDSILKLKIKYSIEPFQL